jgi:hypothetical protein
VRPAPHPQAAGSPVTGRAATISPRLMTALDAAWARIRELHPDVPEVVITMASGSAMTRRGSGRLLGQFASARWQRGDDRLPELFVSGEGLGRGARDVLGTLIHEAAHGVAYTRRARAGDDAAEIKRWADTSRQGRFHNKRFAAIARELGLDVEQAPGMGWSDTSVPDGTAAAYRGVLRSLSAALVAFRHAEQGTGRRTSNNNYVAAVCECGRRIRAAESVLDLGPITCALCGSDFVAAEHGG